MTGHTRLDLHSVVDLGGDNTFGRDAAAIMVDGDINVSKGSGLIVRDPVITISGNITCDASSHALGQFQGTGKYAKYRDFDDKLSKKN